MKTMNELRSVLRINEVHHLPLLTRGVAMILLSTFGIAAVMAWMPTSTGEAGVIFALDNLRLSPARLVDAETQIPPARIEGGARVSVKCTECSVVESMREIEQLDDGIDPGAEGGVTRGGRNEIAEKSTKSYEITVRMKDGSSRVLMDATPANWRPGERVTFIEGSSRSNE